MLKLFVVLAVALIAIDQQVNAFKIVQVQQGPASVAPAPVAQPAPAFNPNALIQGVQGAVTSKLSAVQGAIAGKLSTVQALLGRAVQLKQNAKQNFLQAVTQKFAMVSNGLNGILATGPPVYKKVVYVHVNRGSTQPAGTVPVTQATTNLVIDSEPLGTPKPLGYKYSY